MRLHKICVVSVALFLGACSAGSPAGGPVKLTPDQLTEIDATINLVEVAALDYANHHGGTESMSNDKLMTDINLMNIAWNQYQTKVANGVSPTLAAINSAIASIDADMGAKFVPVTPP